MNAEQVIAVPSQGKSLGRFTLLMLCLTIAAPMLAAYWIFQSGNGIPTSTINKGSLIQPATVIEQLNVTNVTGADHWLAERRWRVATVTHNQCDQQCLDNLYISHQVHVRLAKEAHRIQRLLVIVSPTAQNASSLPESVRNDSGLNVVTVTPAAWQASFSNSSLNAQTDKGIVLIDQENFAMMHYNEAHSGSDLLDDLTRLLKYSYE